MVTLVCGKDKVEVTPQKAQALLFIQQGMKLKGWELPKGSPYEFKDNALIKRTDTKDCKGESKPKRASTRNKTPGATKVSRGDDPE